MPFNHYDANILYTSNNILLLISTVATAANVNIRGKVIDEANKPLEFVNVRIAGTALGTSTGLQGDYKLSCPASDTIVVVFSSIGYVEEKRTLIDASGDVTINMRMRENSKVLGEVEVTEIKSKPEPCKLLMPETTRLPLMLPAAAWSQC